MRPASSKEECFYCHSLIGEYHKKDCVLIQRKVIVKMEIEYEVSVPSDWDEGNINFHRNDSSWCANNAIDELQEHFRDDDNDCMCHYATFKYIKDSSEPYLDEK